jgi:hypothetical protein
MTQQSRAERLTVPSGCTLIAAIAALCLLMLAVPLAQTRLKPQSASVTIDYDDPPANMKTGDEVTTTIVFLALADTERLEVEVDADDGLQILSTPTEAVFTDIKKDETRQLQVKVKLTDPKGSSLNVSIGTVASTRQGFGSMVIDYGEPRH